MATYAILVDETKCTGCRACQIACKQWNDLPAEKTRNRGTYTNPPHLSAATWNLIEFHEVERGENVGFYFLKRACMHCLHPACASVCPVGALRKASTGAVVYDDAKCIGCRYCMAACPFGVPTFDWKAGLLAQPLIRKCTMCFDRTSNGLQPMCAKTCPASAIQFGERDTLIGEATRRLARWPERYVNHVYGVHEAGGTSVLYLAAVPFAQLGLPNLTASPAPHLSEQVMSKTVPFAVGWTALLAGVYALARLRERGQVPSAAAAPADPPGHDGGAQ